MFLPLCVGPLRGAVTVSHACDVYGTCVFRRPPSRLARRADFGDHNHRPISVRGRRSDGRGFSIAVTARPPAGPSFSAFRTAVGAVGSLLAVQSPPTWMAEEIMKPRLQFSSFRVGHSGGLAVLDPSNTLLDRRTTPLPRRSMRPSAWWSTLRNWTGLAASFTRMMIKLQHLDCYFLQALPFAGPGLRFW